MNGKTEVALPHAMKAQQKTEYEKFLLSIYLGGKEKVNHLTKSRILLNFLKSRNSTTGEKKFHRIAQYKTCKCKLCVNVYSQLADDSKSNTVMH